MDEVINILENKSMSASNRLVVIGIDGASWNFIKPLIRDGKLPIFKRLMEKGAYGNLESTIPSNTGPAWTSAFTGVNPGKHNIFWLFHPHSVGCDIKPVNASDKRSPSIWKILSEMGQKVVVINVPISYPPDDGINGIMISGMDTPSPESEFTFPRDLKNILLSRGYIIDTHTSHKLALVDMLEKRKEVILDIMRRFDWNFFTAVLVALDHVQHFFWQPHLNPVRTEGEWEKTIREMYSRIDEFLGQLLEITEERINIIILSDHGFSRIHKAVFVNNFLRNLGLLKTSIGTGNKMLRRFGLTKRNFLRILRRVRLDFLGEHMPKNFMKRIPADGHLLCEESIDWSKTKVWLHTSSTLELNLKGREPLGIVEPGEEYNDLRNRIIRELKDLRDPATNGKVIHAVFKREEIYQGAYLENAPDLIVIPEEGYQLSKQIDEKPLFRPMEFAGHWDIGSAQGIFLAFGPDISMGKEIFNARIIDIAPTILHMMEAPIPRYMDGRVLKEIFRTDNVLSQRQVVYTSLEEERTLLEKERIKLRLRELSGLNRL